MLTFHSLPRSLIIFACIFLVLSQRVVSAASSSSDRVVETTGFSDSLDKYLTVSNMDKIVIPFDSWYARGIDSFILPQTISQAKLAKLLADLTIYKNRMILLPFSINFKHDDILSITFLQKMVINTINLSTFIYSIYSDDTCADSYVGIDDKIRELSQTLSDFFFKFKTDLSTVNIYEIDSLRQIILDKLFLDKLFFIIQSCANERSVQIFIDFIFTAVNCEEDEKYLFDLIKDSSCPDFCIPLPLDYILHKRKTTYSSSPFDLIFSIISKPSFSTFDSTWFDQVSFMIRFNLLSPENVVVIANRLYELVDNNSEDHKSAAKLMLSAIASDEHILPKNQSKKLTKMMSVSSHMKFDSDENLKTFLTSIWNVFGRFAIPNLNFDPEAPNDYTYNSHKLLEKNIPGIIETIFDSVELHGNIDAGELETLSYLSDYIVDISTDEKIADSVDFLTEIFLKVPLICSVTLIRLTYFQINRILLAFLVALGEIEQSEMKENFFTTLTNAIALNYIKVKESFNYLPDLVDVDEISLLLNLVFEMDDFRVGTDITVLVLNRIIAKPDLIRFFFDKFADNLKMRPDFLCLTIDLDILFKIDPEIIRDFMSKLDESDIEISTGYISFVELLFQIRIIDFSYIDKFLDKFQIDRYLPLIKSKEFISLSSTYSDDYAFVQEYHSDYIVPDPSKKLECLLKTMALFQTLSEVCPVIFEEINYFLPKWVSSRISMHKNLIFKSSTSDSLESDLFLEVPDIDAVINRLTKMFLKLITFGSSKSDLRNTFEFIQNLQSNFYANIHGDDVAHFAFISSVFNLILLINRSDQSIVPVNCIAQTMISTFILKYSCISSGQLLYLSASDPEIRVQLFASYIHNTLSVNDNGRQHLPTIFDRMTSEQVNSLIKTFISQIKFSNGRPEIEKVDAMCYWMSINVVETDLVKQFLTRIKSESKVILPLEIRQKLFFSVFSNDKMPSSLKQKVLDLVAEKDSSYLFDYPESLSVVASLSEYENDISIQKWLSSCHLSFRTIFYRQKTRNGPKTYTLSEGLEAVIVTYRQALTDIYKFNLSPPQKQKILMSIFSNFNYLTSEQAKFALLEIDFLRDRLDEYIHVSVILATQIINDRANYYSRVAFKNETIKMIIILITKFVRRASRQTALINCLVRSTKNDQVVNAYLLDQLPEHMNWRRFYLSYEAFCHIFYFFMDSNVITKFMERCVDSVFVFEGFSENEAQDMNTCRLEASYINCSIFLAFSQLIPNLPVPDRFSLRLLDKMIEHSDKIPINSPSLLQFLMAVILPRGVTSQTEGYRILVSIFGADALVDRKTEVVKKILEFLEKRHDFMNFSFSQRSDTFYPSFLNNLFKMASKDQITSSPILQVLHILCNWDNSKLEDLQLIASTELNDSSSLTIASCFSASCLNAHKNVVEMAFAALNRFPASFNLQILSNEVNGFNWISCAEKMIKWFTIIIPMWTEYFIPKLNFDVLEKIFNILLWVEDRGFLLSLFRAVDQSTVSHNKAQMKTLKSKLITLLGSQEYKERFQLLRSRPDFYEISSILRKWSSADDSLTTQIKSLPRSLLTGVPEVDDQNVIFLKNTFQTRLSILTKADILTTIEVLKEFIEDILILRSAHEIAHNFDLIDTFLTTIPRILTSRVTLSSLTSENQVSLLKTICELVILIEDELCFYSNPTVFNLLLELVIISSSKVTCSSPSYETKAIEVLLNLITSPVYQRMVIKMFSENLSGQTCLLPLNGFPSHFIQTPNIMIELFDSCMFKLDIFTKSSEVLDSNYFIRLFSLLTQISATDDKFITLFNFGAKMVNNAEIFSDNSFCSQLKDFTVQRKQQLIPNIAQFCITTDVIEWLYSLTTKNTMIMSVLGLIYSNKPKLFEELVQEKLSVKLQTFMNEVVQMEVLEKKKRVINDFLEKKPLPSVSDAVETITPADLLKTLSFYSKLDFTLLTDVKTADIFKSLNGLLIGLLEHLTIQNYEVVINVFPSIVAILTILFKHENTLFVGDLSVFRKFMKFSNVYLSKTTTKTKTNEKNMLNMNIDINIIHDIFFKFFDKLIDYTSSISNNIFILASDFELVRSTLHLRYLNTNKPVDILQFSALISKLLHDPNWGTYEKTTYSLFAHVINDYSCDSELNIITIIQSAFLHQLILLKSSTLTSRLDFKLILELMTSHALLSATEIEVLHQYINNFYSNQ